MNPRHNDQHLGNGNLGITIRTWNFKGIIIYVIMFTLGDLCGITKYMLSLYAPQIIPS